MMTKHLFKPAMAAAILFASIAASELFTNPDITIEYSAEYFILNYSPLFILTLLLFAFTNRLFFSSLLSSLAVCGLIAVNNLKYSVLHKPLIPSDFLLLPDLLRKPDLFLKYTDWTSCLLVLGLCLFLASVYRSEKQQFAPTSFVILARLSLAAVSITFFTGITDANSFVARTYSNNSLYYSSWDPRASVRCTGFFHTFIRMSDGLNLDIPDTYGDTSKIEAILSTPAAAQGSPAEPARLPDIVVVQSESFYDIRQHELEIEEDPYAAYDRVATQAAVSGRVRVPSIGGNTAKTEFSFLAGIESTILDCDYPYRFLVKRNIWSLAWYLKSRGYQTVAIHPYHRTFWERNQAYPFLGFDRFIHGKNFTDDQREGFFVSDRAVARKVEEVKKSSKSPIFIFVVTMENHGPWDKKRVANRRKFSIRGDMDADERTSLGRYLHHVTNAGEMALGMTKQMEKGTRPCVLAFYGDHAPGLSFDKTPLKPGRELTDTPYFIWKNFAPPVHSTRNMSISFLAAEILDQAGINGDLYFRANSYVKNGNKGFFDNAHLPQDIRKSYTQLLYNNLSGDLPNVRFASKLP